MTVTKTQLADAYSAALTEEFGEEWDCQFSRKDANRILDTLWPVVSELALKDTKKKTPGSVPLGHLGRIKMRYKAATKARKGTNPFTGEPATFAAKPATLQPRFTPAKVLGVRAATLSDLVNEKASLSPEMALRIELAFGVKVELLMRMQTLYDSLTIRGKVGELNVQRYQRESA